MQGAASFMAMREYEKHQAANGQPPNHQFAKEVRPSCPFYVILVLQQDMTANFHAQSH